MYKSCLPPLRRIAAVGSAVAIVAASSAFGIGVTAASADEVTSTSSATVSTTPGAETATPTTPTATSAPEADRGADGATSTPSATPSVAPSRTPARATPAASAPTGERADAQPSAAVSTPVTWPEASSETNRIVITATAGEPFSHTFVAQGGDGPLEYLFNPRSSADGWEWNEQTGVLTATPTAVGPVDFDVTATDLHQSSVQWVTIDVRPGAADHLSASVYSDAGGHTPAWSVDGGPDGGIAPIGGGAAIPAIPVEPGASRWFSTWVLDRVGNPRNGRETPSVSEISSSDADDTFVWDPDTNWWKVTFGAAGRHRITMTADGLSLTIPVDVADTPLAFTEQSSSDAPLALEATSGTAFSHPFAVQGATGPVEYSLAGSDGGAVIGDGDFFRSEFSIDPGTGVLSGTPKPAADYDFEVIARSGSETATAHVTLTVEPGAPVGVLASVSAGAEGPLWEVSPDGTITKYTDDGHGEVQTGSAAIVPADQGIPLFVQAFPVDANGNRTSDADSPHPVVTSDVATDRVTWDTQGYVAQVDFPHASIHTLTVTADGVSTSFRVDVRPHADADAVGSSTTRPASGSLAYTGADESAPVAWALGLLAAGGALLVHRLRRRRA